MCSGPLHSLREIKTVHISKQHLNVTCFLSFFKILKLSYLKLVVVCTVCVMFTCPFLVTTAEQLVLITIFTRPLFPCN